MKEGIIFITSFWPYGTREVWLKDEIQDMAKSDSILPIVVPRRYEPHSEKYDFNQNIKVLNIKMISFKILINTFVNFFNIFSITNLLTIKSQSQGVLDLFKRMSILPKTYFLLKDLKELKEQKNIDIRCIHGYSTTTVATIGIILSKELNIPFSFTIHTSSQLIPKCKNSYSAIIKKSSFIRTISNKTKKDFINFFPDLDMDIRCIYLGIKPSYNAHTNNYFKSGQKPIIITMACVLEPYKDIKIAIDSLKILKKTYSDIILEIYGDGSQRKILEDYAIKNNVSNNIIFKGMILRKELMQILTARKGDILLISSNSNYGAEEGIPVIIMEAMRAGMVVAASNNGAISEIIEPKNNGYMFEEGNIDELIENIRTILSLDDQAIINITNNAMLTVESKFNSEKNAIMFSEKLKGNIN